ncbi:MAG: MlaA family lipoprotein, partial [Alphaproteobacteria bacterium]
GQSVGRFGINTTVGVVGLMDVADGLGLKRHEEDFGETMGHYGVGQGPYLVLPVLGSSSARDFSGRVVDEFLNPLHYVSYPNKTYIDIGLSGGELVSSRAHKVKAKMRAGEAVNPGYEMDRDRYLERKRQEIENDIDTDGDEASAKGEQQMAQLAAPTSVISAPSNQMDAVSSIRDQLAAMKLAPAALSVNGTTLSVELPPNVSSTPLSCSDVWAKMNLDKLAGIEKIEVSVPMGSSHFSCTRFLNPTPAPSLPPQQPGPPAKGAPQGLPGA